MNKIETYLIRAVDIDSKKWPSAIGENLQTYRARIVEIAKMLQLEEHHVKDTLVMSSSVKPKISLPILPRPTLPEKMHTPSCLCDFCCK